MTDAEWNRMMKALEADGAKLAQLTDEDHGPWEWPRGRDDCAICGGSGVEETYGGHGTVTELVCECTKTETAK